MTSRELSSAVRSKLSVFVSSRIQECAAERSAAKRAISSLNHQPILFEHVGARSKSPRNVYISQLNDAQLMVAIYKDGYGYIDTASGMVISGIEDELQFAQANGIPTLIYTHVSSDNREPKLVAMLDSIGSDLTFSRYETVERLEVQIREDVTAEIAEIVLDATSGVNYSSKNTQQVICSASSSPIGLIERPRCVERLRDALMLGEPIHLVGAPGSGKSTLLALTSQALGAKFVLLKGLALRDIFLTLVDAIKGAPIKTSQAATLDGARFLFVSAWAEQQEITLCIDDCGYPNELISAIELGGGVTTRKRVLFSSAETSSAKEWEIPPVSKTEIEDKLSPDEIALVSSAQIPLSNLSRLIEVLRPRISQPSGALCMLALSSQPLPIEALMKATGEKQPEAIYEQLHEAASDIADTPMGLSLINEALRSQISEQLRKTPQRKQFYASRIVDALVDLNLFRRALSIAQTAELKVATRLSKPALREAVIAADWRVTISIADQMLVRYEAEERTADLFETALMLIYPLEMAGEIDRANDLLKRTESLAADAGEEAQAQFLEFKLASDARRTLSAGDIDQLKTILDEYEASGDEWQSARLRIELSALMINAKRYEEVPPLLNPALEVFKEYEDEYGQELALRNLASAYSGMKGFDEIIDHILEQISQFEGESYDSRRSEAWRCNVLTRRLRRAGRYEEAVQQATRSVELAIELGDESLRALNLINLGNSLKDQGRYEDARTNYSNAGIIAQKCNRRDLEADASLRQAELLNEEHGVERNTPKLEQAITFAEHAIALLKDSAYAEGIGRANSEIGEALEGLGQGEQAAKAYFEAAKHFSNLPDTDLVEAALIRGSRLSIASDAISYLELLYDFLDEVIVPQETLLEQFCELLGPMIDKLPSGAIIPVLSAHLNESTKNIPPLLWRPLLEQAIKAVERAVAVEEDRLVRAAVAIAPLLRSDASGYYRSRLSVLLARRVGGISFRQTPDGASVWTVTLGFADPIFVSISTIDTSKESLVAALLLTLMLHCFDDDLQQNIVPSPAVDHLSIHIAKFGEMPEDLQQNINAMIGDSDALAVDGCSVTRPADFSSETPTFIVLANQFFESFSLVKSEIGSNHSLFFKTFVEIAYQFTGGDIDDDELRQAVYRLFRTAL